MRQTASMDERQLARYFSMVRIVMGTAAVLAPAPSARSITGAGDPSGTFITRAWGVRDAALGAATLRALDGSDAAALMRIGAVVDAVDGVAAVLAYKQLRPRLRAAIVLAGIGAAVAGMKIAGALER